MDGPNRRNYIGGPDMSAILGVNPYLSPMQVYANKAGLSAEFTGNEYTWLGSALEPALRLWYRENILEGDLEPTGEIFVHHEEHDFLAGHPDDLFLLESGEISHMLEIKCIISRRAKADWGLPFTDQIPKHYLIQIAYYLMLTGAPYCDVVAAFIGDSKACYRVQRNAALESIMLQKGVEFWQQHVMAGVPPPVEDSVAMESQNNALGRVYPSAYLEALVANPEIETVAQDWRDLDRDKKTIEEGIGLCQAKVKAFMGAHEAVEGPFGKINWAEIQGRPRLGKVLEALTREFQIPAERVNQLKEDNRGSGGRQMRPYWRDE